MSYIGYQYTAGMKAMDYRICDPGTDPPGLTERVHVDVSHVLLAKSGLNFVGNVEGHDLYEGKVDVVVCDGFVGNILLKFGESIPHFLKTKFKAFADVSMRNKAIGLLVRNALRQVLKDLDYQEHGGVPLLGVNGVAIIGHGKSTPLAIKNMIYRAEEMVLKGVNKNIQDSLASINE